MIGEFAAGMCGVCVGFLLWLLGRKSVKSKPREAMPITAEEERQQRKALRELANFYAYDGTAQAETDEAALSK